ncbi:MAG: PBP1A family penicillin-binding protein [Blastocatellales bacterium]
MARQDFRYLTWREAPFRRTYYHATSRVVLAPLLIIGLILIGVLFYYYSRYSAIIDAGLRGDIFVRSSGIYAAPLTLRDGGATTINGLVAHLQKAGYQQGGPVENDKRGHYSVRNNVADVYPGSETRIDGEKAFPNLRVVFGRTGEGVRDIVDLDSQQRLGQAQVEPELISSVVNQEREKRKIIEYKDLRPETHLVDAITAIEDRQFFEHSGINWRGVLRAFFRDYQAGELKEGGSSITQQLVKNLYLKPDKTPKRKLSEAYMSVILEQRLNKEEIMAMYCNQIYLGQRGGFSINGFGEAARAYFGKDVSHLALHESALLAGIIRSPNYYSPFSHEDRAKERRNLVLEKMVEADKITRDQANAAKKLPLGVVAGRSGAIDASDAPYFVDYLTRQLESQYDERGGNLRSLRIYSTIDLDLQHAAYQAVSKQMVEVDRLLSQRKKGTAGLQCAMVAMNSKTGEILAMVGGRDYARSQLNRATDARRQPGSVFKPFVYAAAIALGGDEMNNPITTATTFVDEPKEFEYAGGIYAPSNFGDKFEMRPMTVRDALVQSKNVITVEIASQIGFASVARMAERAGLTKVPPVPSVALGVAEATPLQMASAYTSFANQGRRVLPVAIKQVTTKDGSTLFKSRTEPRDVMSPQVAYIMTSMMQDVLDRGTGTRVRQMGFTGIAAGKTGSSRDAWFAGYTPNLVCVVWIGYDDNSDIGLTGGIIAAPIWADFMNRALRIRPELGGNFEDPGDLDVYEIDPMTGAVAHGDSGAIRREYFLRGTGPGDGQPLPDGSIRESEPPANPDGESPRPVPTPRSADSNDRITADIGGIDPGLIPLPPEARKTRPRPGPEPTPGPNKSFTSRVKEFFGFGAPAPASPSPTPNPPKPNKRPERIERENTTRPAPKTEPTLRPVTFDAVRTTAPPRSATAPKQKPKPTPRPQVATRPRTVTSRKQSEKTAIKTSASKSDKEKLAASKSRNDEKKLAKKGETNTTSKQAEVKKTVAQIVKSPKPSPTPKPEIKAAPAVATVTPAVASSTPRGEGTFTLEICSVSGLLPVRGVCKNTVRKRFKLGSEPTRFCNASH